MVKDIDLFGYPVHLNFDEKGGGGTNSLFLAQPTHRTCLGGLMSLSFLVVSVIILVNQLSTSYSLQKEQIREFDQSMNMKDDGSTLTLSILDLNTGTNVEFGEEVKKYIDVQYLKR